MKTKYLGKTNTNKPTGFKILDPIPRNKISKSFGVDFWNAYEFSYLDSNKNPMIKVMEIKIPSSSINIVESKSLLFCNEAFMESFSESKSFKLFKV